MELNFKGDVVAGAYSRLQDRGIDSRGVGDVGRVGGPAAPRLPDRLAGDETGTDHHREGELVRPRFVGQEIEVTEADDNFLAGQDVGHRLGEEVGPLLVEQRGGSAGATGLVIKRPGFLPLPDDTADDAISEADLQVVDRGSAREREDVDRFDGPIVGVLEDLAHADLAAPAVILAWTSGGLGGERPPPPW